jgi:hypothetical protein
MECASWILDWRDLDVTCAMCPTSTDRQRWARVPPALAWQHPGLPTTWTRVLERNPEAIPTGPNSPRAPRPENRTHPCP